MHNFLIILIEKNVKLIIVNNRRCHFCNFCFNV